MASTITPDELRERVALLPFVQEFLRQLEAPTGDADAAILMNQMLDRVKAIKAELHVLDGHLMPPSEQSELLQRLERVAVQKRAILEKFCIRETDTADASK